MCVRERGGEREKQRQREREREEKEEEEESLFKADAEGGSEGGIELY